MAPAPRLTSQAESSAACDCAMLLAEHASKAKADPAKVAPEIRRSPRLTARRLEKIM
jgi:hypothetical protein